MGRKKQLPDESLLELKTQLEHLPARSPERLSKIQEFAHSFGVTPSTIYRQLSRFMGLRSALRADRGHPRILSKEELLRFCDVIAALKIRTRNKKGRRMSTATAIRLLEGAGVETPEGLLRAPVNLLKRGTVNRYLADLRLDARSLDLAPVSMRFQATHSNECWQFDLSPSDLKEIEQQSDLTAREPGMGKMIPMLYSVVDDRSGVSYQEYHLVQGEDVLAALQFFYRACSAKEVPTGDFPFHGIPKMLYMDNGPIAKSKLFRQVMTFLGVEVRTHEPQKDKARKKSARAKGKVERPFRTVKEVHETLYHFHKPKNVEEANRWLVPFLQRYNAQLHRSGECSRMEDWIQNLPSEGLRPMCSWERFIELVREPLGRKVGSDAFISLDGVSYRVDGELINCEVTVWYGPLDDAVFVDWKGKKYGPYSPVGAPIPLNQYRALKKTSLERKLEELESLAQIISIPRAAMESPTVSAQYIEKPRIGSSPEPDPFFQVRFANALDARRFLAKLLNTPLGLLPEEELEIIEKVLSLTLEKSRILDGLKTLLEKRSQ